MEQSILKTTKKICNVGETYVEFDMDFILYINSAFATLHDVGIGPVEGFEIEDDQKSWEDLVLPTQIKNLVKQYVFLKTAMLFDPPQTSYLITAKEKQLDECLWRISVMRENLIQEEIS